MTLNRHRAIGALALAGAASLFATSTASACPACQGNFETMLSEANLVFRGTVTDVSYRLSEPGGPNNARIPFTFVTYEVSEVFLGSLEGNTVTLRFTGGWEPESQRFLHTSVSPLFDKGDHDIMFVAGNTERVAPLAGGMNGRLRLIDGQVYDETGREILLHGDKSFRFGDRYFLPEVFTSTVGDGIMTITMDTDEDDLHFGPSRAVSERQVIRAVRNLTAEQAAPVQAFVNANPALPIPAPDMTPVAPPAETALERGQSTADQDGREGVSTGN